MKKILLLFLILNLFQFPCIAQKQGQGLIDSLLAELPKATKDTNQVKILLSLCNEYKNKDENTKGIEFGNKALELSQKLNYKNGEAKCFQYIGLIYNSQSDNTKAMEYFTNSIKIDEISGNKRGLAKTYSNVGVVYLQQSNYSKALDYYFQSLKINEAIHDKTGMANAYGNIGIVYMYMSDFEKALEYYNKTLKLDEEAGYKIGIAEDYINIGGIYDKQKKHAKALNYFMKAASTFETTNDYKELGIAYIDIGALYVKLNDADSAGLGFTTLTNQHLKHSDLLDSALLITQKALAINKKINDRYSSIYSLLSIGAIYYSKNKYKKAIDYFQQSYLLADSLNALNEKKEAALAIAQTYKKQKDWEKAYSWYEKYSIGKDSVLNDKNNKEMTRKELKFEYDKKAVADSVKSGEEKIIISAELKQEQTKGYAMYGGLALLLVFGGFMFNRFRVTQKQKNIIEHKEKETQKQKSIIEEKQKEILGSIEYALRIQTAILPPSKIVKQYLENSFILYKPKDIVAGDFYWMETANDLVLFAACDCTGHGVPGAMVSVVCHNALNRAVREFGLTEPAKILDKTAEIVIENFSKSEEDIKDGMDISLCAYNAKTRTIEWAGANNPLWLLQNGELIETKANKQPIGMNENSKPFTNHTFTLQTGETIYLFTDGFADQFGGETGQKKLTKKRFKDLILSLQNKSLQEQGIALDKFITDYRKEVEQIDDILVIGVKV